MTPPCSGGRSGMHRRAVGRSSASSAASMPRSSGHAGGDRRRRRRSLPSRSIERRRRVAADEREAAPSLAVLDRLEQEAGAVADELGVRRDRRLEVGEQLGPDRHDGVLARQGAELVARRSDAEPVHAAGRSGVDAEAAEEARVRSPVWQAPCPPARPRTATRRRRSRSTPRARTDGRRWCRPCATAPGGCGSSRPSAPRRR